MKNTFSIAALSFALALSARAVAGPDEKTSPGLPICSLERLQELKAFATPVADALMPKQVFELSRFLHASIALDAAAKLLRRQQDELESRGAAFSDSTQIGYSMGLDKGAAGLASLSAQFAPCTAEAVRILAPADFSKQVNKQ